MAALLPLWKSPGKYKVPLPKLSADPTLAYPTALGTHSYEPWALTPISKRCMSSGGQPSRSALTHTFWVSSSKRSQGGRDGGRGRGDRSWRSVVA